MDALASRVARLMDRTTNISLGSQVFRRSNISLANLFNRVVRARNVKPVRYWIARNARGGQDVTKDDREIVSALRARLADRVGKDRYEVWFGATTQLCVRDGTLTVGVPNRFYQDWLRNNFRKDLEASCIETLGQALPLEFRIDPSLAMLGKFETLPSSSVIDAVGNRRASGRW